MKPSIAVGLLFLSVHCILTAGANAQIRPSAEALKKSVGLLFYDDGHTTGAVTAFCIGADGTYLTNRAALWTIPIDGIVKIYLKPGQKDQRIVEAQLKMRDAIAGLALVRAVDAGAGHVPLNFASERDRGAYTVYYEPVKTPLELGDKPPKLRIDRYRLPSHSRAGLPAIAGAPVVSAEGLLTGAIGDRSRDSKGFTASLTKHESLERLRELPVIVIKPMSLEPEALAAGSVEFDVEIGRTGSGRVFNMKGSELAVAIGAAPDQILPEAGANGVHRLSVPIDRLFRRRLAVWVELQIERKTGERIRGLAQDTNLSFPQGKVAVSKLKRIEIGEKVKARGRGGERYEGHVDLPNLEVGGSRTYLSSTDVAAIDFGRIFTEFPDAPIQFAVEFKKVGGDNGAFARGEEVRGEMILDNPKLFNRKTYFDELEAAAGASNGKPVSPKLAPEVVLLPARVEDVSVGGSGRYLVFYFGAVRKIGVFDLESRKLGASVALEEGRVMIAAGRDRVIGIGMETGKTNSWALPTLEPVSTGRWPQGSVPKQLSMGSDASRAIALVTFKDERGLDRDGIAVVDASSVGVQEIRTKLKSDRSPIQQALMEEFRPTRVISSQSGNSFSAFSGRGNTISHGVIDRGSAQLSLLNFAGPVASVVPSNTGSIVFTSGQGIFDSSLERGYDFDILHLKKPVYLPSENRSYFLSLAPFGSSSRSGLSGSTAKKGTKVFEGFIHDARTRRPVGVLPDLSNNLIEQQQGFTDSADPMQQVHKRFIFSPKHKVLVTFSQDLKSLELFPISLTPVDKWEHGVLQVKSQLHLEAKKGERFEFRLKVDASDPPLRYLPPKGSADFTVTADGKFSWDIPADYGYSSFTNYLEIVDAKGRHLPFRVRIKTQ